MLWLALSLVELPLEACALPDDRPVAIVERRSSRRWILASSSLAKAAGVDRPLDATSALGRLPELQLIERSRRLEKQALEGLAVWSEQVSSFASFDAERLVLWLEIGSGLRYFGGLDPLLDRVRSGLAILGYTASLGVAPTPEAALAFARAGLAPALDTRSLLLQVRRLPLSSLSAHPETLESLTGLGLGTLADVLALPRDQLAKRYGPEFIDYLQRLLGERPDPLKQFRAPERYKRSFELLGAVETFEGLLFPLKRILVELEGFLRGRDAAVQSVQIECHHERRASTMLELRSTRPTHDAARLLMLARERIERSTLEASVSEITVHAKRLLPAIADQLDLVNGHEGREDGWSTLLDRLRARLGDSAVRRLGLHADYRPEKAWCLIDGKPSEAAADPAPPSRPLWLLTPRELDRVPRVMGTPERIESGWWDGETVRRDYYIAETRDGARWWLYRELGSGKWFLHGLWG